MEGTLALRLRPDLVDEKQIDRLRWPIHYPSFGRVIRDIVNQYHEASISMAPSDGRDALLLGGLYALISYVWLADEARAISGGNAEGMNVLGLSAAGKYIAGATDRPPPEISRSLMITRKLPLARLRSLKVNLAHSSLRRGAWRPGRTTTTTWSRMVEEFGGETGRSISFRYPQTILPKQTPVPQRELRSNEGARTLAAIFRRPIGLTDEIAGRLEELVQREIHYSICRAEEDLDLLDASHSRFADIWSGSGGNYASRLIGMHQLRTDQDLTRFSHGGMPNLLFEFNVPDALIDLVVSTKYVFPNAAVASLAKQSGLLNRLPNGHTVEGLMLRDAPPSGRAQRAQPSPIRVMYAPSFYREGVQFLAPFVSDPVYRIWQRRLSDALSLQRGVSVVLKPHPEGPQYPLPMSADEIVDDRSFEQAFLDADVLIFDYLQTSTLASALRSNKGIVILDLMGQAFLPELAEQVCERCSLVELEYDSQNLPMVSGSALSEAIWRRPSRDSINFFHSLFGQR